MATWFKNLKEGTAQPTFYPYKNKMDYKVHRWGGLYLFHECSNENVLTVLKVIRSYTQT